MKGIRAKLGQIERGIDKRLNLLLKVHPYLHFNIFGIDNVKEPKRKAETQTKKLVGNK